MESSGLPSPRPRLPGTGAAHRQAYIQGTWLAIVASQLCDLKGK